METDRHGISLNLISGVLTMTNLSTLGHVPTLNPFIDAINHINAADSQAESVNLTDSANASGMPLSALAGALSDGLTAIMQDANMVKNEKRHSDTALYSRFKKAVQRHNSQILWVLARPMFETDGQTVSFLSHVKYDKEKKDYVFTSEFKAGYKINSYSTFTVASSDYVAFGAKVDDGKVNVELTAKNIDIPFLMACYDDWKASLDSVKPIEARAETAPSVTLETTGDVVKLENQLRVMTDQHKIDVYQLESFAVSQQKQADQLAELMNKMEALQKQADYWRNQALIKSAILNNSKPASAKKKRTA